MVPSDYFVSTQLYSYGCFVVGVVVVVGLWQLSETNLISITNLGLNLNIASIDQILNKESSPLEFFSELSKLRDYSMETRLGCFYVTAILSSHWVEVMVEDELRLRLIWTWGWNEVEMRFSGSGNWVKVELSWSWDKLTLNKGRNWAFIGVGLWFKICFRSTYVAEQHMFSMLLLISSN